MVAGNRVNRKIVLRARPEGPPAASCFGIEEVPVRALGDAEVLVEVRYLSIDPAMRAWLDADCYVRPVGIGETLRAIGVGITLESGDPGFRPGDAVFGMLGVQELAHCPARTLRRIDTERASLTDYLGVLGVSAGLTAWFGLCDVGQVAAGERVVVSGAAGAVGSLAGQIAKLRGARVIGIAGGPAKCAYLTNELGFDGTIDYKHEDVAARLGALAPEGVDVFFDNVGGAILDAVLDRIRTGARVVLCGAISQYDDRAAAVGPRNYLRLAERNARMAGFTIQHYAARYGEAETELGRWLQEGRIRVRSHIEKGVESFPATFRLLFDGGHMGKLMLEP